MNRRVVDLMAELQEKLREPLEWNEAWMLTDPVRGPNGITFWIVADKDPTATDLANLRELIESIYISKLPPDNPWRHYHEHTSYMYHLGHDGSQKAKCCQCHPENCAFSERRKNG